MNARNISSIHALAEVIVADPSRRDETVASFKKAYVNMSPALGAVFGDLQQVDVALDLQGLIEVMETKQPVVARAIKNAVTSRAAYEARVKDRKR